MKVKKLKLTPSAGGCSESWDEGHIRIVAENDKVLLNYPKESPKVVHELVASLKKRWKLNNLKYMKESFEYKPTPQEQIRLRKRKQDLPLNKFLKKRKGFAKF